MTAVIKYDAGNISSILHALARVGAEDVVLTDDPALIRGADKVLLPGVGDASVALASLRNKGLDELILSLSQPVLGICVGMQLLCKHSEEGDADGLGIFDARVRRFRPEDPSVKVPHMGWNALLGMRGPLFEGIPKGAAVYFVHSYHAGECAHTIASCEHGVRFSAALCNGNFFGTQFHPEKSGSTGARILQNFLAL